MDNKEDPPPLLTKLQEWFASIITQPMQARDRIDPLTPQGTSIEKEAKEYVLPSQTLAPHERMEIYNQQYWWRLLRILANEFPMLVHLFGRTGFHQTIALPFLTDSPPNHWSLELLGERLPEWIKEAYHEQDRELVQHCVDLDWAFSYTMIAGERAPLTSEATNVSGFLAQPLYLQPFVTPFSMPFHLFAFREALLAKESSYWIEHPFPLLPQEKERYFFVFYRSARHTLLREEIDAAEYHLLASFVRGASLGEACHVCEKGESLANSLQQWAGRGWLTTSPRVSSFTTNVP